MKKENKAIYVTQPALPSLEEFHDSLKIIWDNKILTNNGPFHQQLEEALADYLGVKYISLFANGTLSLITALQALHITGEVITTPFSFVATTHSLWWNNIKPVFVDIENEYFNLDPEKIEAAITPKTTAILPVHVYGNPCKLDEIQKIADTYGLKLIYDAAHAFGVKKSNTGIANFGDLSILSFHATKVFNTIEGGAIISHDAKMKRRIDFLKNFGFADEETVVAPGINAKMNEIQAAFGLLQLQNIDKAIGKRKLIAETYKQLLTEVDGVSFLEDMPSVKHNYAYFPILVDEAKFGICRNDLYDKLKKQNIHSRKYFYPLISQFPPYSDFTSARKTNLRVANRIAEEVLCLPIYSEMQTNTVEFIVEIIKKHIV
jgi:dTDP-4-amino-4,6-dideoxygalactose transaminase